MKARDENSDWNCVNQGKVESEGLGENIYRK